MKRRPFFKAFAALAATIVLAPSVLAKLNPEESMWTETAGWLDANINEYLERLTRYAPEDRILFVGPKTYKMLNELAANQYGSKDWNGTGVRMTNIHTSRGSWPVLSSPQLADDQVHFVPFPNPPPFFQVMNRVSKKPVKPKIDWVRKDISPKWHFK